MSEVDDRKEANAPVETEGGTPSRQPNADVQTRRASYNKLARTAQLADVLLTKVDFSVSPSYHSTDPQNHVRKFDGQVVQIARQTGDNLCLAEIKWTVSVVLGKKKLAKCDAHYVIIYDSVTDADEDSLRIFIESVGRATAYSYFRGLCAQLDWAGGLRLPPLPVHQFTPNL